MGIDRSGTTALYSVCTSSTRPTGPTEGMMIYETDTNNVSFYSGSDWVSIGSIGGTGGGYAPTGSLLQYGSAIAPSGWLLCNASAVSRTTYTNLFSTIVPSKGTFTVTIASPAVVTLNSHGLLADDAVYLTTTSALPTGLSANTIYYVKSPTTNTFNLAVTRGGANINTSGAQGGTHTLYVCPYGLGDGSTTFNLPDLRGRSAVGLGTGTAAAAVAKVMGLTPTSGVGGEETHLLTTAEMPSHTHTQNAHTHTQNSHNHGRREIRRDGAHNNPGTYINSSGNVVAYTNGGIGYTGDAAGTDYTVATNQNATATSQNTGGDGSHNIMQPFTVVNYIIKT